MDKILADLEEIEAKNHIGMSKENRNKKKKDDLRVRQMQLES